MYNTKLWVLLPLILLSSQLGYAQQDTYVAPSGTMYTHPNATMAIFGNLINDAQGGFNHNNGGDVHLYRDAATGTGNSRIYDGPLAPAPTDNYNAGGAFVRFYNILTDNTVGTATPSGTAINTTSGAAPIQVEQEARVSNNHTFVNGMLWTPRAAWQHAYVHYESAGSYFGVSDAKHIDGYAASTDKATFDYPIGEGTRLRISGVVGAANGTYKSAYFQKNAQLGTTGISGNNASTGPMNGGIQVVNTTEFWDIDGTASSQFKLTALNTVAGYSDWNIGANFGGLQASDMVITAYDPWENLGITGTPGTLTADGAFVTTVATQPDAMFSAYTWANKIILVTPPDINATFVNVPVTGSVSTNDTVPVGTTYGTPTPVPGNPGTAVPTMNPDGTYTFTSPVPGTFEFMVPVCPPGITVNCPEVLLTITVTDPLSPTNPPTANTDIASTPPATPVTLNTLANDAAGNPDNSLIPSSVMVVSAPSNGTTSVNPTTGEITYTPNPGFDGIDTLEYVVCDDNMPSQCDTAYQFITVLPTGATNTTVAADDYNTTPLNTPVPGNVLDNDADPESNTQTVTAQNTTIPGVGTLVLNTDGSYVFTPEADYTGPANFHYTVCDNGSPVACTDATLYILVEPSINADPDINQTLVNTPVPGDVSTNDEYPTGSTFAPIGNPPNGTIAMNPDGTYTYTPSTDFVGTDSVQYTVCSPAPNSICDTTWLVIEVAPVSTPPGTNTTIAQNDAAITPKNTPVDICIACNDNDPQGNDQGTPILLGTPPNGTAVVNPNGTVTYTPNTGFVGVDTFFYAVCDNGTPVACDTAQVIVDVPNTDTVANQTYANDDANSGPMDTPQIGDISENDTDPQSADTHTFTQVSSPTNGTVVFNTDGTYTYTPTAGYIGPDQFVYSKCDNGTPTACDTATVYLTVHGVINADPDINQTTINTPVTGTVVTNDDYPAGSVFTPLSNMDNGTIVFGPNGTYTYTPNTGFEGTDSMTYVVCAPSPNGTLCDTTTLTIEIRDNVIDPATNTTIAQNDQATTPPGTLVNICVACNDDDPEGNTQANPTLVSNPPNGTVTVLPNGTIDYTPNAGFTGVDTFTYSVCDNGSPIACDIATVVVNVPNVSPTTNQTYANDDAATTPVNTAVSGDVSGNDTDPQSGDTHVYTQLTNPTNGMVVFNANGTYTYTPSPGYIGPDQFTYTKCDDGTPQACENATVYLTVFGGNMPLPVVLKSFDVINTKCNALITWVTASEENADYMQVMRKEGNGTFEVVHTEDAIGNSSVENQYNYMDIYDFKDGIQYQYKLKMVDIDGKFEYSDIDNITFNCDLSNGTISIFPNPVTDNLNIILSDVANQGILNFELYNSLGQVVYSSKVVKNEEEVYRQNIDVTDFSNGIYHLRITGDNSLNKAAKILIK